MAKQPKKLRVVVTQNAAVDLAEIWVWNARRYDFEHAEGYAGFLERESNKLSVDYNFGRAVQGFRDLRYLL